MRNIVLSLLLFLVPLLTANTASAREQGGGGKNGGEGEVKSPTTPAVSQSPPHIFMVLVGTEWDGGSGSYGYANAYIRTLEALPPEVKPFLVQWQVDVFPKAFRVQGHPGTWLAKGPKNVVIGPVAATTCFLDETLALLDTRYGRHEGDLYVVYSKRSLYDLETLMKEEPELHACADANNRSTNLRNRDYTVITQEDDALVAVERVLDNLRTLKAVCTPATTGQPWCNLTISPYRVFWPPIRPDMYRASIMMPSRVPGQVIMVNASYGWDGDKTTVLYESLTDADAAAFARRAYPNVRLEHTVAERLRQFGIEPLHTSCIDAWPGGVCMINLPWTTEIKIPAP